MMIIPNLPPPASHDSSAAAPPRPGSAGRVSGAPAGGAPSSAAGDFFGAPAGAVGIEENAGAAGANGGGLSKQESDGEASDFLAALGSAVAAFQRELDAQGGGQPSESAPEAPPTAANANAARQLAIVRQIPAAQIRDIPAVPGAEEKPVAIEPVPSIELPNAGQPAEGAAPVARVIDLAGVQISEIFKSIGEPAASAGQSEASVPDFAAEAQAPVSFADLIGRLRALADEAREILGEAVDTALEAIEGGAAAGEAIAEAAPIEGALAADPRAREIPLAALESEESAETDFDAGADGAQASEIFTSAARSATDGGASIREAGFADQIREAADFLATRLEGAIRAGQNGMEADLRLNPPDLGRVRIELQMSADRTVQTHFIVQSADTGALIQQNARHFAETLGAQGMNVERVQVTVEGAERSNTENRSDSKNGGREKHPAFERSNDGGRNAKRGAFDFWQEAAQA